MDSDFLRLSRRVKNIGEALGDGGLGDSAGPVNDGDIVLFDGTSGKALKSAGMGLPGGPLADTSSAQTLANKTLASPAVTSPPANIARMPGEIALWAGGSAPEGWLLCNGAAVSRTTYAALFAVTGTAYGSGNGSTTFNLPNLKGRVPVGLDGGDASFDALGETGGAKTHTLVSSEMPAHTHVQNSHTHGNGTLSAASAGGHRHSLYWPYNERYVSLSSSNGGGEYHSTGYATGYSSSAVYDDSLIAKDVAGHTHSMTGALSNATPTNQDAGGGGAHNNLPPYIVLNYIIKT